MRAGECTVLLKLLFTAMYFDHVAIAVALALPSRLCFGLPAEQYACAVFLSLMTTMIRLLHHCPSVRQCTPQIVARAFPRLPDCQTNGCASAEPNTPDRAVAEAARIILKHPADVPQYFHPFVDCLLLSKRSHQHHQLLSSGTAGSTDKQGSRSWLPRAHTPAADPARTQEGSVSQTGPRGPDTELPKQVILTATKTSDTRDTGKWGSRVSWPAFEPSQSNAAWRSLRCC
jgi:hypothetical protein